MMRCWGLPRNLGRRRSFAIVPVALAFALVASGCTKMTGGGWIESEVEGYKATFGFTAQCKNTTTVVAGISVPTAVLHSGQFEFQDHGLGISVHGTVQTLPLQEFQGQTCKDLRREPNLFGTGIFGGTYRTQPGMTPSHEGEFFVQIADGAKVPTVDLEEGTIVADEICVELAGGMNAPEFTYHRCGELQGGNIKVE